MFFIYPSVINKSFQYRIFNNSRIGVFKNQGLGVFAAPVVIDNSIFRPRGLNAVDLELDGDLDLVCGSENSIIVAYLNDGNGNFGSEITISNEPAATRDITTTDFTGDGLPDFAIASYNDDSIVWLENRGLATRQINGKSFPLSVSSWRIGCQKVESCVAERWLTKWAATLGETLTMRNSPREQG